MNTPGSGIAHAQFSIGDLVHHRLFDYRGVVVDVDAEFQLDDEWYETVARSRPPKDRSWYHVLVHEAAHMTYVAERNLEPDPSREPIEHPMLGQFFSGMANGRYVNDARTN
ncbi:MAG: heat shock protein HspQ [Gammaproteobacteria bacterium]